MSFAVSADAYDRFMGRYSAGLATEFADFAGVSAGQHLLDVGCGPGALTAELVRRFEPSAITAVDPSEKFVAAVRERLPGVTVQTATAEALPFPDNGFDAALAQLVVHFMADPVAGLAEMARVVRPGGVVAACVWDHAGGTGPLSIFWQAAQELDPNIDDESELAGARRGHLSELLRHAGVRDVEEARITTAVEHETFEDWWQPYTLGVGPAGAYTTGLDARDRAELRERCRQLHPRPPFTVHASAWAARGVVSS